jgi:YVTN family beta-propeller protein
VGTPPGRRRLAFVLAFGAVVTAAVVATVVLLTDGGPDSAVARVPADSVGIFQPADGRLTGQIPVGGSPGAVAVGNGSIWVANVDAHSVSRVDPVKQVVIQSIQVGNGPAGIAFGGGFAWVTNGLDGTVSRIDPQVNRAVQKVDVGNGPVGIAYAAGSVWVANTGDDTITVIDAESGTRTTTLPIAATQLAVGDGSLWASESAAGRVVRIDARARKPVQWIHVGNGPTGLAFGDGSAWVTNSLDGTVSRIDPETDSVLATIPAGNGPTAVAVDTRGVWVSNEFEGSLVRIDPRTNQVDRRINVGNRAQGVAVSAAGVVVGVRQSGARHRGGTLTVKMNRDTDSIDTAVAYDSTGLTLLRMTNDGLVAFDQASGVAGTQLVPDLAVSLPAATDGGRTYAFRLRPNIRYSDGRQVRASDFRSTFERDFEIGKLPVQYYDGIVGALRCKEHPKRCDLSRGVVPDDAAETVTFHLVAPDPEFLYKLALDFAYVVPAETPPRETGTHALPATGPYMIASYRSGHFLGLVRNPRFREWSKAAQPDGYPDRIAVEIGGTPDEAVDAVIRGHADAFSTAQSETPPSAVRMVALTTRHASQVHMNPQSATIALFLNTRLAPFDRLDVRRALNYAVDRAAAIEALGGPGVAQSTCQVLPPHFPGYRPYCPYSADPSAKGSWTAPDLAKARALVARSGTRGMRITFWSWGDLGGLGPYV